MPKFPARLYARRDTDTDGTIYFLADKEIPQEESGVEVATYQLVTVERLETTRRLVPVKRGRG